MQIDLQKGPGDMGVSLVIDQLSVDQCPMSFWIEYFSNSGDKNDFNFRFE